MKRIKILIIVILGIIITSCAKKYDGCCTYTITYVNGNPSDVINDCFTQQSKAVADGKKASYNNARHQALNSSGQPYESDISGPGCNY